MLDTGNYVHRQPILQV